MGRGEEEVIKTKTKGIVRLGLMFCQLNVAEKVRERKFIMIMIGDGYGGKLESGKDIKQYWSMN